MRLRRSYLKQILKLTRDHWDDPSARPAVRSNFEKVLLCRTAALGAEVYASKDFERTVYHTCKSRCCPSCGNRGTALWQRDQWAALPNIPFVGFVLTMPDVFWPIFKANREMQQDLPDLGAAAIQQWVWNQHRVKVMVIVVPHTFGSRLNYHPHLHIMVSAGGLNPTEAQWLPSLEFDRDQIMELWRFAVTSYLRKAYFGGKLARASVPGNFNDLVAKQERRKWNLHIQPAMSKSQFLRYAGRYIRRLPVSEHRILHVTEEEVTFQIKDTRSKKKEVIRCKPAEFVASLSQHVHDRYRRSMRYYGLLAPRTKRQTSAAMFALLAQEPKPKPKRLSWAQSIKKDFGYDPLIDEFGNRMRWTSRLEPLPIA